MLHVRLYLKNQGLQMECVRTIQQLNLSQAFHIDPGGLIAYILPDRELPCVPNRQQVCDLLVIELQIGGPQLICLLPLHGMHASKW